MHAMRPSRTTATRRLLPHSETRPDFKKLKISPWPSKSKTDINDLPDFVLVEILCRLPHNRFVFQCKRVCKRWSSLISDEKFRCRFLWLQSRNRNRASMESSIIFRDPKVKSALFMLPELELPMFKSRNLSWPRLGATEYIATGDDGPNVVGMCNDLVLLCEEIYYQRDYFIWNPYTKQYVGLPSTPRCYREVRVGFICDPYYKQEDIDDQKEESVTGSGMIQVDSDYRYAIVRICPDELGYKSNDVFKVEIFSSETRKWTESLIRSSREFCLKHLSSSGGIAHNGLLHWLSRRDGFIVSLDPFCYSNNNNSKQTECPNFHIMDMPYRDSELYTYDAILSVCRGQLRMCLFSCEMEYDFDVIPSMSVFELKNDDGDQGGGKWWNLVIDLDLNPMVCENPVINYWSYCPTYPTTLALNPSNEDILYLELFDHIVACNIRERKLTETTLTTMFSSRIYIGVCVFPFVLPRWPTPLPRLY